MSEQTNLTDVNKAGSSSTRLPSILLGLLAGGVVLAFVWFFLLAPGGDAGDEPEGNAAPATTDAQAAAEGDATLTALDAIPVTTYEVYLSRDPFEPVVEPASTQDTAAGGNDGTTGGDGGSTTDGTGTDGTGSDGTGGTGTDGSGGTSWTGDGQQTTGTCVSQEELVCDGRVLSLQSLTTRNGERVAVVQVGTDIYEVARGEIFAGHFRVLEFLDGDEVLVQYGENVYRLQVSQVGMK